MAMLPRLSHFLRHAIYCKQCLQHSKRQIVALTKPFVKINTTIYRVWSYSYSLPGISIWDKLGTTGKY